MTPEEKFLFDLQGYLVIKNALTPGEVADLNAIADEKFPRVPGTSGQRTSRISHWGPPCQALIDHPRVLPYLIELIDSKFRLDHDYCIFMSEGDTGGGLHGGEGGFACIPGTHKSHFNQCIPSEVRRFERPADYVVQPAVEAGDALFFTEALIHGTMTWRARHERRSLLYKYSPGHSAWSQSYYDAEEYPSLTEQQRRILAPPSVGRRLRCTREDLYEQCSLHMTE